MNITRPASRQPMPDHATKVFEGVMFDVYQWEQELFDGTKTTFEKIKRPDTVITFPVLEDGCILLTKQEQPGKEPFVGAAGGRVDRGEEIFDAAKRELLEESGYEAHEWVLWKSLQPMSKVEWAVYVFIAKDVIKISDLSLDAGEKIESMPVTFEEFLEIGIQDNFAEKEIVTDIYEARSDTDKKKALQELFQSQDR